LSERELRLLAEEQAALRRVATLVARGTPPEELFAAVVEEVGRVLAVDLTSMCRYDSDGALTFVASWGLAEEHFPVGTRTMLGGRNLGTIVLETGESARFDHYAGSASGPIGDSAREAGINSSLASPITVEGRLWGVIAAGSIRTQPLPPDTEARLASFTELVATAIANAAARAEVGRLAEEQAALRRVATLVARGAREAELFGAVTEEVGRLMGADLAGMLRYEPDGAVTPVAAWSAAGDHPELPDRWPTEDGDPATLIAKTRRAARMEDWSDVPGPIAAFIRDIGIRSSVGIPILVGGGLWGALAVHTRRPEPLPADVETRLENFAELVATAISNTEAWTEVAASRARTAAATVDERRRVARDLHDGAQQRLVHTVITLKQAQHALRNEKADAGERLAEGLEHAQRALLELRELAHGILPAALTNGGLDAGVDALASRMPIAVENRVTVGRLPAAVEATAYFVVAEALTNVAKHARARRATVTAGVADGSLRVGVRDDGVGGARPDGSGLLGLADRVAALGGQLQVEGPADGGTFVVAAIPLEGRPVDVR
jgi:signal transduction histidine kinase